MTSTVGEAEVFQVAHCHETDRNNVFAGETLAHLVVFSRPGTESLRDTEERMLPLLRELVR